jgi:hypothetical protein
MDPKRFLSLRYVWRKWCTYHALIVTLSPNGLKQDFTWPMHLGVASGACKMILSLWYVRHKPCTYFSSILALSPNISKWASSWPPPPWSTISCVQKDFWAYVTFVANRAPILHRHKHFLKMDHNEIPYDPRHLGFPSGVSKTLFETMVSSAQTMNISCVKISTISKWTEMNFHLSLIT